MTEDKLSSLFDEIRNESAQTSVSEVDKWIEKGMATAATIGLLATLKLILIKKPLIMWATLLTITGGVTVSTVLLLNKPQAAKEQQVVVKRTSGHSEKTIFPVASLTENKPQEDLQIQPFEEENGAIPQEDLSLPLRSVDFQKESRQITLYTAQTDASFTKLALSGAVSVELTQGKTCSVKVVPESATDQIKIEIKGGTLYIGNVRDRTITNGKIVNPIIQVSIDHLDAVVMDGATSLKSMNEISSDRVELEARGASDMKLDLKASEIVMDFSGASDVKLSGSCQKMEVDVSGAADVDLSHLIAKTAEIDNSGAAQLEITVSQDIKIDASGASSTIYKLVPGSSSISTDIEKSGGAVVKKI
jgi:hypothetical protein